MVHLERLHFERAAPCVGQGELSLQPLLTLEMTKVEEGLVERGDGCLGQLIGREALPSDYLDNFIALRPCYRRVENVHTLTPAYLKDQSAYRTGTK